MLMESWRLGIAVGLSCPLGCPRTMWLFTLLSQSTAPHWDEGWDTGALQLLGLPLPQTVPLWEVLRGLCNNWCQRIWMGQKLLGCEAPQGQAVADQGQ